MKVLFICYTDFNSISSGSSVRPYKIYNAFINKGYEVILINGNVIERREKYLRSKRDGKLNSLDYCYIEPSTYPCHPLDYLMFLHLKTLRIPVGLFYRDMYYKFPTLFKKKGIKKAELLLRYKIDWNIFKLVSDVIFFPSDSMAKYFKFNSKAALPPAGDILNIKKESLQYNVIYVGGVSKRYGTDKLLEAMQIVNDTFKRINLILVCRDYDDTFFKKYENEEWLSIKHVSGEELEQFYSKSDVAIIPIQENEYHNFAVPIKLFEYLSYNMPIVTTNCFETARFVVNNQVGIVTNDSSRKLADAIIEIYKNNNKIYKFTKNAKKTLLNGNLWRHRVDKIEKELLTSK